MLHDRNLAKKHVFKAIAKAKKSGAAHVGLGAYTSVVTAGGAETKGIFPGVHITNGNALTAYMTYLGVKKLVENHSGSKPVISIIGATGSVGAAVTELLTQDGCFETLYVVGRTPSSIFSLLERLKPHTHSTKVIDAVIAEALPKSDIILSATSANGVVIEENFLKKDAIIYDITQPKNTSIDLLKKRPDVTVIDGGLVQYPTGVKIHYDMGVPKGTTFSCLAETMLLSLSNYPDNFCLGHVTLEQVSYIGGLAEKYGFIPVKYSK
jgi:fatty aldehyde-generating acyl-ACP reductase